MLFRTPLALILASLAVGIAAPALADRRSDDANDGLRDDSLWKERESYRTSGSSRKKAKVTETAGKIKFESQFGKGGGAAYLSGWKTDWTDSFSVTFKGSFSSSGSNKNSKAAYSGIGFGFDAESAYNVAKGFRDGVQVEFQQTKAGGRTLQIVARKNGAVIAQSVGVPAEGIGIILGVDRLLDMCRTVLNVTGDLVVAACVAGREPTPPVA